MARLIIPNRRGHQTIEWDATVDSEETQAAIEEAERIIADARRQGCLVSRKVDGQHVLDTTAFDPQAEEYQIIAPIAGG